MQLSKSDYLLYLKQPAWLWLKKNDKNKLPQPDAALQAIFDAGYLFESYAEKIFPDGITLGINGYSEYLDLPDRTREAIISGAKTILQGRLEGDDITCIFDVIQFISADEIDLFEIKSSTGPRTYHEHDLAFQAIVLEDSGYRVRDIKIVHVNKDFVRKGEIKPSEIASISDVTDAVKKRLTSTREGIKKALEVAKMPQMPDPSPAHCSLGCTPEWTEIYKQLKGIKNGDGSIYDIYNPSSTLIGKLEEAGITKLADIPVDFEGLSEKQRWQVKALKAGKVFADKKEIKKFLDKIKYPIYFLDYETLSSVIPYFDGHKPFQQVPFQYSLHYITEPGADVAHIGYLHSQNTDPIEALSKSLKESIGDTGTVLVWWQDFEKGRNTEMGEMLSKYKKFYEELNLRVLDLIEPFFDYHYVDARFGGSASIKDVLPVLVPELSHKDLEISEGGTAQRLWMEAVLDEKRPDEKEEILNNLWQYCELDTMAMVEIWDFLERLVDPKKPTLHYRSERFIGTDDEVIISQEPEEYGDIYL